MRSTFFGLNTALTALVAQRKALEVSAHNVANANTDGYTRQDALMVATAPYTTPTANRSAEAGQIGTGVEVSQIRRLRDNYLDQQIREQLGLLGSWQTTQDYLEQVQSVVNEPSDSGVNALLGKMWSSWQDLSVSPDSYAAKAAVVQNATVLADVIRREATQLSQMRDQASSEADIEIGEVNGYLQQIADLNRQIQQVQVVGDNANDLTDKRDLLLDKLSEALPVTYDVQPDVTGTTTKLVITLDGHTLVDGSSCYSLRAETNSSGVRVVKLDDGDGNPTNDPTVDTRNGEISSLLNLYNSTLNPSATNVTDPPGSLAWRLDALASTLIREVNNAYDPTHTVKFFDGTGSSDISVDGALIADPNQVRAGSSGEAGDGSVALAVSRVPAVKVDLDGNGTPDATIGDWYQEIVSKLGIDCKQAEAMTANQKLLVDHLKTNREAMSGVSLDEESANMVRFQRAYEAAARVMTAVDDMLDKLINGTGMVGR